jgi:DnaJ-class molecular chaperone
MVCTVCHILHQIAAVSSHKALQAYLALSKKYHPDLHAQASNAQQAKATAKFADITSAYSVLSDPQLKAEYDMNLSASPPVEEGRFLFYIFYICTHQGSPTV